MRRSLSLIALPCLLAVTPLAAQEAFPDPVIAMRQQWLDADSNAFNFRNSAQMFETRTVARSGAVWTLPREGGFTPPSYSFDGQTRSYAALRPAHLYQCDVGHP